MVSASTLPAAEDLPSNYLIALQETYRRQSVSKMHGACLQDALVDTVTRSSTCRRRLVKRVYIPLPDPATREAMLKTTLQDQPSLRLKLSRNELHEIVRATQGYSGSDLAALCREAAWVPLRYTPSLPAPHSSASTDCFIALGQQFQHVLIFHAALWPECCQASSKALPIIRNSVRVSEP